MREFEGKFFGASIPLSTERGLNGRHPVTPVKVGCPMHSKSSRRRNGMDAILDERGLSMAAKSCHWQCLGNNPSFGMRESLYSSFGQRRINGCI
jgi:hypothetical protein